MTQGFTYKESGVDTREAAAFVREIGDLRRRTEGKRKLFQAFGLFAASYDLSDYREPVIVTGCDGVGTKIALLLQYDQLEIAGKDLVAMNVNDVLTTGADPLLFLDYVGISRLDPPRIRRILAGMTEYLEDCDCILGGGETAEMPGLVPDGMIELSGFCVGAAEKNDLIDPGSVDRGDVLIGFPSDGLHANGWSLVRRILRETEESFSEEDMVSLLAPTRLYHRETRLLRKAGLKVKALAHITGGGLPENLERLLGENGARLRVPRWECGAIPRILRHVEDEEACNTFNMGFGWVAVVSPEDVDRALEAAPEGRVLGEVTDGEVTVEISDVS